MNAGANMALDAYDHADHTLMHGLNNVSKMPCKVGTGVKMIGNTFCPLEALKRFRRGSSCSSYGGMMMPYHSASSYGSSSCTSSSSAGS